ncbi:hypothetical protein FB567DRAFT_591947 [Paraphoma chrysanthemicola]|uniref:WSC domain-containing protein n=1 Tax=Paraphoma chrysanthemicola TaxID=798071 RepID=A0A8K0RAN6_9PLEO|nr:hypothetical protein FB567DRAFT_591947 [Paraphoma chrysanthemicola]
MLTKHLRPSTSPHSQVQSLLAAAFWLHPSQVHAAVRRWQPSQLVGSSTTIVSADLVTVINRQVQATCATTTTISELPVTVINSVTETLGSPLIAPTVFPNNLITDFDPDTSTVVGCFPQLGGPDDTTRVLDGPYSFNQDQMTDQECKAFCTTTATGAPYVYFGIARGRDCYCGNTLLATTASDPLQCTWPNSGNGAQAGGSDTYQNIWQNVILLPSPSPSASISVAASSSQVESSQVESTPVESSSMEPPPVEPTPVESSSIEPPPVEPTPVESSSIEPPPVEPTPMESSSIEPPPIEPSSVEPTPVEPSSVEPTPIEPSSIEPPPVEPSSIEPTPVEPSSVEPPPIEPSSVEPTPATSPTPLITNFDPLADYLGCFPAFDSANTAFFTGPSITSDAIDHKSCLDYCNGAFGGPYKFFGIQGGNTCRCTNSYSYNTVFNDASGCQTPTANNGTEAGGSDTRITAYLNKGYNPVR